MDGSCEPMDVDVSSNSAMDISHGDSVDISAVPFMEDLNSSQSKETLICNSPVDLTNESEEMSIKKYHIDIKQRAKKIKFLEVFIVTIVIISSFVTYQLVNLKCSDEWNLRNLEDTLLSKLYGQHKAIDSIIEILSARARSKLVVFYGGTGVGKTFTSSLILDTTGYAVNMYHYTMPSFTYTFSPDVMFGLTFCQTSLLIVDDLIKYDDQVKTHILNAIQKSENLNKNITIILIYNCDITNRNFMKKCDNRFHQELSDYYSDMKVMKKFIKFEPLTEKHLRKCIENELGVRSLSEQEFKKIVKNFNVSSDGCKGVHTKLKLFIT